MIVFREGLEAVLIFAAVTASFRGANARAAAAGRARRRVRVRRHRRDVVRRAGRARRRVLARPAAGGDHRLHRDRRPAARPELVRAQGLLVAVDRAPPPPAPHAARAGRASARPSASSRSGSPASTARASRSCCSCRTCSSRTGPAPCWRASAIGLAATAVVGALTFWLHAKLPYRRMLILTGVLVGIVLVVMIGGTALSFVELGWLPRHDTPFTVPEWLGLVVRDLLRLGDARRAGPRRPVRDRLLLRRRIREGHPPTAARGNGHRAPRHRRAGGRRRAYRSGHFHAGLSRPVGAARSAAPGATATTSPPAARASRRASGKPEPGAAGAADAGREDPLRVLRASAAPSLLTLTTTSPPSRSSSIRHLMARVPDRVLEQRMQRSGHQLLVGADRAPARAAPRRGRPAPRPASARPPRRRRSPSGPAPSRRAATSSVSITAAIRSVPASTRSSASRNSASDAACASASSASARTPLSGVRSSCAISAEKRCSWRSAAAIRPSRPSSVARAP